MAHYYEGVRVSKRWAWMLRAARKSGVRFRLNDGKRTRRMQRARIAKHGLYDSVSNPHGAAKAVPWAPHIKFGQANHAIDVDQYSGDGEQGLQNWLQKHGLKVVNNVATEGWHLDPTNRINFLRTARRLRRRFKVK